MPLLLDANPSELAFEEFRSLFTAVVSLENDSTFVKKFASVARSSELGVPVPGVDVDPIVLQRRELAKSLILDTLRRCPDAGRLPRLLDVSCDWCGGAVS